jgi:outer membrane protein assembly factor BamB
MRRMLNWCVAAVLACGAIAAAPAGAHEPDTSIAYQANAAHTGEVPGSTLAPPLIRAWSRTDLGPASYPIVADGLVIVTAPEQYLFHGTTLHALDVETGATLWSRTLGGLYAWSGAAYEDGRVFVLNSDGFLRAFDARTGETLWAALLPVQWTFTSPPTVRDGVIYTTGAGMGGTLYAVDAATGALLWSQRVSGGHHSSPAVDATHVYVAFSCPNAYAFARVTGALAWHFDVGCSGGGGRTTAVHEGRLYFRNFDSGFVVRATDGTLVDGFGASAIPAFSGSTMVYRSGTVVRAERSLSFPAWTFSGDGNLSSAPLIANGRVYLGSLSGTVYGLDLDTGREVWRGDAGAAVPPPDEHNNSAPLTGLAAGHGRLAVATDKGVTVFVSQSAVGKPIPKPPRPASVPSAPIPATAPPAPTPAPTAAAGGDEAASRSSGTARRLLSGLEVSRWTAGRDVAVQVSLARAARLEVRVLADSRALVLRGARRQVTVGHKRFHSSGGRRRLRVRLSRGAGGVLERRGRLRARVLVTATRGGHPSAAARRVILRG